MIVMENNSFRLTIRNSQRKIGDVRKLFRNLTKREIEILEREKQRAEREYILRRQQQQQKQPCGNLIAKKPPILVKAKKKSGPEAATQVKQKLEKSKVREFKKKPKSNSKELEARSVKLTPCSERNIIALQKEEACAPPKERKIKKICSHKTLPPPLPPIAYNKKSSLLEKSKSASEQKKRLLASHNNLSKMKSSAAINDDTKTRKNLEKSKKKAVLSQEAGGQQQQQPPPPQAQKQQPLMRTKTAPPVYLNGGGLLNLMSVDKKTKRNFHVYENYANSTSTAANSLLLSPSPKQEEAYSGAVARGGAFNSSFQQVKQSPHGTSNYLCQPYHYNANNSDFNNNQLYYYYMPVSSITYFPKINSFNQPTAMMSSSNQLNSGFRTSTQAKVANYYVNLF